MNRGDNPTPLKKLLTGLVRSKCDIIVCAARTRGAVGAVLSSFEPPYQLIEVPKIQSKNAPHPIANIGVAHNLASLVYAAIDA